MGLAVIIPLYLGALFGAKLMFLLVPEGAPPSARALRLWESGYWYHGGLAGALAGYILYNVWRRNSTMDALDMAAPFALLGEAIARIGCFMSGCCWGILAGPFPGVIFPQGSPAYLQHLHEGLMSDQAENALPVQPVQLYMALCMTLLFIVLRLVARKQVVKGEITLLFFLSHCFVRFWTEFLRADIATQMYGLSLTQWGSILLYISALSLLLSLYRRKRSSGTGTVPGRESLSWQ